MVDLEVKFATTGQLPPWLNWESDSLLAGTPPIPNDGEAYKVPITLTASYSAFGMSHVIESRLELDIRSPGSAVGDTGSSLRSSSNIQSGSENPGLEGGLESYLDDDDDDTTFISGQNAFSSETTTPPSAITPSMANPNQLLYVPSQSLQNSPLKQSPINQTPPSSGPSLGATSFNPLTPTLSPATLQFNQKATPRQSTSAPHTPLGGPPSQLTLQIPRQTHEVSSLSVAANQQRNMRFMNDIQPSVQYGLQNPTRVSPPTSAESGNRMYGIDEELSDNNSMGHGYFDDSYSLGLGSPFLER
jgi:hypothetical protein